MKKIAVYFAISAISLLWAFGAEENPFEPVDPIPGVSSVVQGRILVKPKPGLSEVAFQAILAQHGARQAGQIEKIGVRIIEVRERVRARVIAALRNNPNIAFAEADTVRPPELIANDFYFSWAWHLPKINATQAWDICTGSNSVIIAILDTGVESTHPDLAAKLVSGWNIYDNNSNTSDVYGHGTQVAGTAAASSNNATGVTSVAWGCKIMPIRISATNGGAAYSAMANGLTWAADHGARVANISYVASDSSTVTSAAQYFQNRGGVVTVSAGNYGTFDSAADNPYVLTVSATDSTDTIASWSNTGNNIDVAAPGSGIPSTGTSGTYVSFGGTSASAPVVAGVAALVISKNPSLSGAEVQQIIRKNADDLGATGFDTTYGYGRVNAYRALLAASNSPPSPPSDTTVPNAKITAPLNGSTVTGVVKIAVTATDNIAVTKVEIYLDGTLLGMSTSNPYSFSWNTKRARKGTHTLQAYAYDAANNIGMSPVITVTK